MGALVIGGAVQVHMVWAASPRGPLKHWFSGYVLRAIEGDIALVEHTAGMYAGIVVRYPICDVRNA